MKVSTIIFPSLVLATALLMTGCGDPDSGTSKKHHKSTASRRRASDDDDDDQPGDGRGWRMAGMFGSMMPGNNALNTAMNVYAVVHQYRASERQREIAEERGREHAAEMARSSHKKTRYIAVATVKGEDTSPDAKKSVMLYDTQSGELVGDNVYDLKNSPSEGKTAEIGGHTATYVGG